LIHVVETVSATFSGNATDDDETRQDAERLQALADQLQKRGYTVETQLGYQNRIEEIVRIVKSYEADILVMGAHGHRGIKDLLYGQTVEQVRHRLKLPILIVS